jgi:hypothetical protein
MIETILSGSTVVRKPDSIREVKCGLDRDPFSGYGVGVLKAFVDDSGSGDTKYFVMAGYVGSVSAWECFDERWRFVLDASPKIPYFHAVEANSLRPDSVWAGVTKEERDAKIASLIGVIQSLDIQAVYMRMKQSDYNQIFRGKVPDKWDSPYYCLFSSFVSLCGFVLAKEFGSEGPMEFVFDNHEKYKKHGQEFYDGSRLLIQEQTAPNIHFRDDKDFPPLQAADLLAWQVRRAFCYPSEGGRHFYECRKGGGRPHLAWTISPDQLWSWRNKFEEFCASVLSGVADSCGVELIGDVRPWKAVNPDPEDVPGHERWKQLERLAKSVTRDVDAKNRGRT